MVGHKGLNFPVDLQFNMIKFSMLIHDMYFMGSAKLPIPSSRAPVEPNFGTLFERPFILIQRTKFGAVTQCHAWGAFLGTAMLSNPSQRGLALALGPSADANIVWHEFVIKWFKYLNFSTLPKQRDFWNCFQYERLWSSDSVWSFHFAFLQCKQYYLQHYVLWHTSVQ